MDAWEFHQRMRVRRSQAMYAMLRKVWRPIWRRMRAGWRHSGLAWRLSQVG